MFDKLKELVGDNSEALAEIENAQKAVQESTSTINKLEKQRTTYYRKLSVLKMVTVWLKAS